ncbi:MAG TPA: glucokinase [Gammaproteobacteria bacterium]|nr:glucokinase [Gammaproteobacteria bacterium]
MADRDTRPRLLADIGGTNTRLALQRSGQPAEAIRRYANAEHEGLGPLIRHYLDRLPGTRRPHQAALAVASPMTGDRVHLTNLGWEFSIEQLRDELALEALEVVNDFAAVALAIPALEADQWTAIGNGEAVPLAPVGALGPGTGLGVAGLVHSGDAWVAIPGEGGHATLPAGDAEQAQIIESARTEVGHVSAERLLSGPGLARLYAIVSARDGGGAHRAPEPPEITRRAVAGSDPLAAQTLALFLSMLGGVAGDLALTLGARGGIYLAGGILPDIAAYLAGSRFRESFVAKGRFRPYLEAIPTRLITHPYPAFPGLGLHLDQLGAR